MNYLLYPRIPTFHAISIFDRIKHCSIEELASYAVTYCDLAIYSASGGARVNENELQNIRSKCLELAISLGYPKPSNTEERRFFDQKGAKLLYSLLEIVPGEAARDQVWSFFGLVLLPDIVKWRFPTSQGKHTSADRFFGGARNTFQRLWWRAHVLRDSSLKNEYHLINHLPEDAFVQIMERPGLSSNSKLASSIAKKIVFINKELGDSPYTLKEQIWRDAIKSIRQHLVVINLEILSEEELDKTVLQLFKRAISQAIVSP